MQAGSSGEGRAGRQGIFAVGGESHTEIKPRLRKGRRKIGILKIPFEYLRREPLLDILVA